MIHTDEDDEFERIEHEAKMRSGQPYHWDVYVSPSQRNQVLEEAAKVFDELDKDLGWYDPCEPAEIIRAMKT
jgi:hypothetical protein